MRKLTKKAKVFAIKALVNFCRSVPLKKRSDTDGAGRFLVVSTTGVGDTLWGTPALKALRKAHPESYIGMLTNAMGSELLEGNPAIDEFFIFKRGQRLVLSLPGLIKKLRHRRFDSVLIFHASDRIIWILSFLTNAREIIGVEGQSKDLDFILTCAVPADNNKHLIESRFDIVRRAGVVGAPGPLALYLADRERETARSFLKKLGLEKGQILIGLHPGAQKPFKCWPQHKFIELGRILSEKVNCRIIVTGDLSEKTMADEVAAGIEGAISAAGMLSLKELAAVIENMAVFVTNDTGPMHIAFAVRTPTVALFSPTEPGVCGPYNAGKSIVIKKPVCCDPCAGKNCTDARCMDQITVQEVFAAIEPLLISNEQGML